jgi:hypothetical protein
MTDNLTHAWRATPLDEIIPYSRLLDDFERAGYETAGDILDAEPWDLVDNVYGVGPKRAIAIRQKVFDYVKPFGSQGEPQWVLNGAHIVDVRGTFEERDAPSTPSTAASLIATACIVMGVALAVYMMVRLAL